MRSSFLSKIASVALVIVSLVLSLWLVEVGLRLYFHGTFFSPIGDAVSQERHPVRGTFNRPNTTYGMLKLAFAATAHINSRGIRGPEFEQVPKPGIYRILVVSDSGSFGSGVNDGEPLPDQMQAILGKDKYEVINLSVAAYTTVQEYLWLTDEGLSYKPNMVILGFAAGNDIQTNYYPLQALFQSDSKRPYAVPDGKGGFTIDNSYMVASAKRAKKFKLLNKIRDFVAGPLVQRVIDQAIEVTTGGRKTDPNIWIGWPYLTEFSLADAEGGRTAADYDKLWSAGWDVTKAVIRAMRDRTESAGAKFVMYSYVNKMQGNPDYFEKVKQALPNLKFDLEKPEREFRAFGAEAGIPVISMYDAITKAAAAGDRSIYFDLDDEHMTAHGHHLAAEALVADLRAKGLLPQVP
jgi:hypothetical protein